MFSKIRRWFPVALLTFVLAWASSVTAQGTSFVYGVGNNVDTLDFNVTTFSSVGVIMQHVTDPLVWQDPLGTFHPGLATEWTVNDDATEYTFTLRQDVTFHDGTPFNAEAVKINFDRIANPDTNSQLAFSLLGPYAESVVVDEYTVTIRFSSPFAPFLDSASTPYLGFSSPAALRSLGADYGLTTVVSTGPYALESYTPDSEIVLVRNDSYAWGSQEVFGQTGPGNFERITFKIILEPATRLAALESGEVNFIDDVPELDVARLNEDPAYTIYQIEQPGHGWSLMFNFEKFPTSELPVRKAVAQAIDKQGLIDVVFNGFGTPGCSALTKVMFAYDPATCDYLPYDPDAAAQTLEEAGWVDSDGDGIREKDGEPLTIQHWFRADNPLGSAMATFIQADLLKVGINFNLNGASQSGYFDAVRAGEHNTQNWWDTQTDPDGVFRTLFWSPNADGGTNRNRYRSEQMDALIDAAAGAANAEERAALYADIQKLVGDEAIMVFMVDPFLLYGSQASVQNIKFLGGGNLPSFYSASFAG